MVSLNSTGSVYFGGRDKVTTELGRSLKPGDVVVEEVVTFPNEDNKSRSIQMNAWEVLAVNGHGGRADSNNFVVYTQDYGQGADMLTLRPVGTTGTDSFDNKPVKRLIGYAEGEIEFDKRTPEGHPYWKEGVPGRQFIIFQPLGKALKEMLDTQALKE